MPDLGRGTAECGAYASGKLTRIGVGTVSFSGSIEVGADTTATLTVLPGDWFFGSPLLGMPELNSPEAGAHIKSNEAKLRLDVMALGVAIDFTGAVPETPVAGEVYLVGPGWPGGSLADIAVWWQGWRFITPKDGMLFVSRDGLTRRRYTLGAWIPA